MQEIRSNKTVIVTSPTIPGWKATHVMGIVTGKNHHLMRSELRDDGNHADGCGTCTAVKIEPGNEV